MEIKEFLSSNWKRQRKAFIKKMFTPRVQLVVEELPDIELNCQENYFIHGAADTGKTILANRILLGNYKQWEFDAKEKDGLLINNKKLPTYLIINFLDLFESIKAAFGTNQRLLDKYRTVDVLLIDDFGIEKISGWEYQTLYSIINYRYEYLKTTYLTSNYSVDELFEKGIIDVRIARRIKSTYKRIKKEPWEQVHAK